MRFLPSDTHKSCHPWGWRILGETPSHYPTGVVESCVTTLTHIYWSTHPTYNSSIPHPLEKNKTHVVNLCVFFAVSQIALVSALSELRMSGFEFPHQVFEFLALPGECKLMSIVWTSRLSVALRIHSQRGNWRIIYPFNQALDTFYLHKNKKTA